MPGAALPRVRADLRRTKMVQDGRTVFVVKDPVGGKYFRFGELEVWIMDRLDGTRSFQEVSADLKRETGKYAPPATIEGFFTKLKGLGLADRTVAEKSVVVMEMLRKDRKARLKSNGNTLFRMRFSWGDPDRLFARLVQPLRFFWTPGFVVASALAFATYAWILAGNWGRFVAGFHSLYQPSTFTPGLLLALYLTGVVVFVIHELGHGLTCKHFGGEVHEMGAMLLYFSPAFYCNVTDAWTFEKRSHRLWTTFAGTWIQLWVAFLAAVVWVLTEPASGVSQIAFLATLLAGGMSVVINYNPLLPLDGYYALLDWLAIPNLRARAMELLGAETRRRLLRLATPLPPATPRERRILLLYGALAFAYTTFILWAVAHWAGSLAVRKLGGWGWVLVAFGAWRFTRRMRPKLARTARAWWLEHRPKLRTPRSRWAWAAAAALVLLAGLAAPWTVRVAGAGVVEPFTRQVLRAREAGWVERVLVGEGREVRAGEVLFRLRNPDLELEDTRARAAVAALEREAQAARARGDATAAAAAQVALTAALREAAATSARVERLNVRAPFAATVASPHLEELLGARVAAGDTLVELWLAGSARLRVAVSQRDAGQITAGDALRIRFPSHPGWTWHTHVQAVAPAARSDTLEVLAPLGRLQPGAGIRPGSLGQARIDVQRTTVAGAIRRATRRLIRTELFL